jgi:hypothetical protein
MTKTALKWDLYASGDFDSYCADGDGIVAIHAFDDGRFYVFEQYESVADFATLDEAFAYAEQLLQADYPAIYADCLA